MSMLNSYFPEVLSDFSLWDMLLKVFYFSSSHQKWSTSVFCNFSQWFYHSASIFNDLLVKRQLLTSRLEQYYNHTCSHHYSLYCREFNIVRECDLYECQVWLIYTTLYCLSEVVYHKPKLYTWIMPWMWGRKLEIIFL